MPTMEEVVRGYVKLRNKKKEIQARHKDELATVNEPMQRLEAWLLKKLHEQQAEHIGTSEGTAYISTVTRAKVEDWPELLEFIREKELWVLLTRAVSKDAVEEYLEAQGELPPGVSVSREQLARVRR